MHKRSFGLTALILYCSLQVFGQRTDNFPNEVEHASPPAIAKNFWIFLMAGQSNMAGRGLVEPGDTLPNPRILTLNSMDQWILAKEPLHYYEPELTGLDCGLSFARTLLKCVPEEISIGIIPCAVGGSYIQQWTGDSIHRAVPLLSNFKHKVDISSQHGAVRGIIWHQGETDAHRKQASCYSDRLKHLVSVFRSYVGKESLPIVLGELGPFTFHDRQPLWDSVNVAIHEVAGDDPHISVVRTNDLHQKGDSIHFDSPSLRMMGERYAEEMLQLLK